MLLWLRPSLALVQCNGDTTEVVCLTDLGTSDAGKKVQAFIETSNALITAAGEIDTDMLNVCRAMASDLGIPAAQLEPAAASNPNSPGAATDARLPAREDRDRQDHPRRSGWQRAPGDRLHARRLHHRRRGPTAVRATVRPQDRDNHAAGVHPREILRSMHGQLHGDLHRELRGDLHGVLHRHVFGNLHGKLQRAVRRDLFGSECPGRQLLRRLRRDLHGLLRRLLRGQLRRHL